jgi:hypothetical protein
MRHDLRTRKTANRAAAAPEPPEIAALRVAGGEAGIARLQELAIGDDRALAKAARRALHTLGAPMPQPANAGLVPHALDEERAQEAWVTGYGFGCRANAIVAREEPYGSAWILASCLLSAETGVVDCFASRAGREKVRRSLRKLSEGAERETSLQVPLPFARWMLADAMQRSSPAGTAQVRTEKVDMIFGDNGVAEMAERFAILEADASILAAPPLRREPSDLCELNPFNVWFTDDEPTAAWLVTAKTVLRSPLVLDEWQVRDRMRSVYADAADAMLTPSVLAAMRHAALANALLYEIIDRPEEARMALYHAHQCRLDRPARDWPLALHIAERTLATALHDDLVNSMSKEELAELMGEEEEDTDSLIIRP